MRYSFSCAARCFGARSMIGAQVFGGFLGQAVLGEDLGLGEVLGDEVEILAAFLVEIGRGLLHGRLEARGGRRCGRRRPERRRRRAAAAARSRYRDRARAVPRHRDRRRAQALRRTNRTSAPARRSPSTAARTEPRLLRPRRHRVDAAHLRADELQLRAMLRVLRLALDQLLEHVRRLLVVSLGDVRLGQAAHRREDVGLLVEPRVERRPAVPASACDRHRREGCD